MLVGCISIGHDQNNDSKIMDRTDTSDRTVRLSYNARRQLNQLLNKAMDEIRSELNI